MQDETSRELAVMGATGELRGTSGYVLWRMANGAWLELDDDNAVVKIEAQPASAAVIRDRGTIHSAASPRDLNLIGLRIVFNGTQLMGLEHR
ncbi:hypothetical protein U9M48_037590 [Paspalum notatum var. saurae]|uniref:Uncharacterized protein n=1 Tax=Paspalum notatum var. saurae TaxID=547442 RepID=A0AAQ3UGR3_PASNO